MRTRVDNHDLARLGNGAAVRAEEGDVDAFVGWGHIPTVRERGGHVPPQFDRALYVCDMEVIDDGVLILHKERAFSTAERARAWYDYVVDCLQTLPSAFFDTLHHQEWRLT